MTADLTAEQAVEALEAAWQRADAAMDEAEARAAMRDFDGLYRLYVTATREEWRAAGPWTREDTTDE